MNLMTRVARSRFPPGFDTTDQRPLGVGQVGFALVKPLPLRAAAAFAIPAAIAGYHAAPGLSQIGVPSLLWREVFAWIGGVAIGCTAWARMRPFLYMGLWASFRSQAAVANPC